MGESYGGLPRLSAEEPKQEFPPSSFQMICQCDDTTLLPDTSLSSEWAYLQWVDVAQTDLLAEYTLATARQMEAQVPLRGPACWTNWQQQALGTSDEKSVTVGLDAIARQRDRLRVKVVQVEEGYADLPGDWMQVNSTRFPHGMPWLAEQIRSQNCIPGLWLAPFVAHPDSLVAADHPEWLLKPAGDSFSHQVGDGAYTISFVGQVRDPRRR